MKDQYDNFRSTQTRDNDRSERDLREKPVSTFSHPASGDARDILTRLYREIGISAVAAALQATEPKAKTDSEEWKRQTPRRFGGYAA
jgi:hypothetical protein